MGSSGNWTGPQTSTTTTSVSRSMTEPSHSPARLPATPRRPQRSLPPCESAGSPRSPTISSFVTGSVHAPTSTSLVRRATVLGSTVVVPSGCVTATVHHHEVTLTGAVAWNHQRLAAQHAVAAIPGVTAVHNLIRIEPDIAMVASDDAKANVTAALLRNAELEAEHVEVAVNGTEIQLTGQVSSWAAQHQAEFAAWCTPGVTHVDNRLVIV
jgi:osmotically-inducible protein OsmY